MSHYTTGEMAKLCHVTVRTVQYYDTRNLLSPSHLSEGGRRLYSQADLNKLEVICFLRNIGLSLDSIARILTEENSKQVISLLLEKQAQLLKDEMDDCTEKLHTVERLAQEIKTWSPFSLETIHDIAFTMEHQNKLRRVHRTMLLVGILLDAVELSTLLLWILKGIWLPFAIGMPLVLVCCALLVRMYYRNTAYLCPQCHKVFRPGLKEFFFSAHTPKTRKLTCTACGHKGFCIETYGGDADTQTP